MKSFGVDAEWIPGALRSTSRQLHRKTKLILVVFLNRSVSRFWAPSLCGTNVKVNGRFTRVPKFSTGAAKNFQACPKFRSLHRSSYRFEPILATLKKRKRARCRRASTAERRCRSLRRPVEPAQPQRRISLRAAAVARAPSEAEKLVSLTQRRSTGGNAIGDSVSSNFQGG